MAANLPDNPRATGRGPTYHAIFVLCYGLGIRAGEACGPRLDDVDIDRLLLVVRGGKYGRSRLVPHGPRIGQLLAAQLERRRVEGAPEHDAPLFTFDGRRSVHPGTASQTLHRLVIELAFPVPEGVTPPHLHCLRHSFAVGCLLRWYREGLDPSTRLYQFSTFTGHVDPTSTAVYLTITPSCSPRQTDDSKPSPSPQIFCHTAAVHLLDAGVKINVIRGWLGHADLTTTNRYAEINTKAKMQALRTTEPPSASAGSRPRPAWRSDESLLNWLSSL